MNAILAALVIGTGGGLVNILVTLLIAALIFWLIWFVIGFMKLPAPFDMIVRVVIGIIAILFLLHLIGIY